MFIKYIYIIVLSHSDFGTIDAPIVLIAFTHYFIRCQEHAG